MVQLNSGTGKYQFFGQASLHNIWQKKYKGARYTPMHACESSEIAAGMYRIQKTGERFYRYYKEKWRSLLCDFISK